MDTIHHAAASLAGHFGTSPLAEAVSRLCIESAFILTIPATALLAVHLLRPDMLWAPARKGRRAMR